MALYRDISVEPSGVALHIRFTLTNDTSSEWKQDDVHLGWQLYDPESLRFIMEGEWVPLAEDLGPGNSASAELKIQFPPERGLYRIYISPIDDRGGWHHQRGDRFLMIDAEVHDGRVEALRRELTSLRRLRWRNFGRSLPKLFTLPVRTITENFRLIRSMVRRDITARYRGSFGDVLWTVLNPLFLMTTYFFVFGVVLRTRFGADRSSSGFVLYFLAGMLPWLAFSEAIGRAPQVVLEHRNFVKKLVFPLETLPVNQVLAGMVTEAFALLVFTVGLLLARHSVPLSVLWLPVLLVPQILFTLGMAWFLAGLGAFMRDLGQIIGFVLTLWFFLTPICYPETSLPQAALPVLAKNPLFVLVRGYRAILLEGHAPPAGATLKLWLLAAVVFLFGHAWFNKLRKSFADVI